MRVVAVLLVAACGGSSASPDGAVDPDAAPDAYEPGMCDAPALFADGLTPTRVLHVSATAAPGGNGTAGSPFQTIQDAAVVAQPGDAIRLGPGTHTTGQFLSNLRGTAQAPIWVGGEPGQPRPVIAGGAEGIHLSQPAYVVVHDLEITGATANGINVDDGADYTNEMAAHHVALVRLHVHDVGTGGNEDCIKVSGVNDLAIYDSRIERCGAGGSGIDHVGCHRSVVARNVFDGVMENAVQAKGGSTDVDIRQNRIRIAGSRALNLGGSTDLQFFRPPASTTATNAEARRVRAFDNIITGLGTAATPFAFVGCIDCLAAHNFVRGQQRWNLRILQETVTTGAFTFEPSGNGRVIANSFVFSAASLATAVNVGADTAPTTFSFANNLWYASDTPSASMPSLPVAETGSVVGMPSGYAGVPDDPGAPILDPLVMQSPEAAAQPPRITEVPGTLYGECRLHPTAIGPLEISIPI